MTIALLAIIAVLLFLILGAIGVVRRETTALLTASHQATVELHGSLAEVLKAFASLHKIDAESIAALGALNKAILLQVQAITNLTRPGTITH